jgi:AcrR family transcriptional regulator
MPPGKASKPVRKYVSSVREAAAVQKREQVLTAATRLLRAEDSIAAVSIEAVAKAAGVTRLTIYNQFQSRRGLLEAVFDKIAGQGGLGRLPDAMAMADAAAALDRLVEIFCEFWSHDSAIGRLIGAAGSDAEFAQTLDARNERRRKGITVLIERMKKKPASAQSRRDAVDMIFALTSYPVFATLSEGRSTAAVSLLLKSACRQALERMNGPAMTRHD